MEGLEVVKVVDPSCKWVLGSRPMSPVKGCLARCPTPSCPLYDHVSKITFKLDKTKTKTSTDIYQHTQTGIGSRLSAVWCSFQGVGLFCSLDYENYLQTLKEKTGL